MLQFSTLVELEPGNLVCPSVNTKSGTSRRQNFPKLGQKLEDHKRGTVTRPDFPGKFLDHSKITKRIFADFATLNTVICESEALILNSYIKNQSSDPWQQGKINRMSSRTLDHSIIRSKDSQNCKMWQLRVHFDKNLIIESQLLICFLESPESILAPRENRTSGKKFFL